MKLGVTLAMIVLICLQVFSRWVIIAEFAINRDYIAKNLCENRFKPMLHCNGKCILMKKLAEEERHSSPGNALKPGWEISGYVDTHIEYDSKAVSSFSKHFDQIDIGTNIDQFVSGIFRPPLA